MSKVELEDFAVPKLLCKSRELHSDLTFTMKLESARYNPSAVPAEKWSEYFAEVFDQLRKYESVEIKD